MSRNQLVVGELTVTDSIIMLGAKPFVQSALAMQSLTPTVLTSGATVTLTAAQVLSGLISDTISAPSAATLPTPASIVTAIPGAKVGTSFDLVIRNSALSAIAITLTANGSSTISGTATIAQNNAKTFRAVVTGVTPGAESVIFYSLGTSVF